MDADGLKASPDNVVQLGVGVGSSPDDCEGVAVSPIGVKVFSFDGVTVSSDGNTETDDGVELLPSADGVTVSPVAGVGLFPSGIKVVSPDAGVGLFPSGINVVSPDAGVGLFPSGINVVSPDAGVGLFPSGITVVSPDVGGAKVSRGDGVR